MSNSIFLIWSEKNYINIILENKPLSVAFLIQDNK